MPMLTTTKIHTKRYRQQPTHQPTNNSTNKPKSSPPNQPTEQDETDTQRRTKTHTLEYISGENSLRILLGTMNVNTWALKRSWSLTNRQSFAMLVICALQDNHSWLLWRLIGNQAEFRYVGQLCLCDIHILSHYGVRHRSRINKEHQQRSTNEHNNREPNHLRIAHLTCEYK